MEIKVVLGSLFGDEGKGATVQWLCKQAINEGKKPLVIRYSGGSQAGHTVYHDAVKHVCSSFGSGVLLGIPTFYSSVSDTLVDPISVYNEFKVLVDKGITPLLPDARFATVVTPYDILANWNDSKNIQDGTCGKGIYKTLYRSNHSQFFHLYDNPEKILQRASSFYNLKRNKSFDHLFLKSFDFIRKNANYINTSDYDVLIYEGTQGLLLDSEKGFKPNVTATPVGIPEELISLNNGNNIEIYLVTRTYLTRHGNGYNPKLYLTISDPFETNKLDEFQGEFKTGVLDIDLLNRAYDRHCLDNYKFNYNLVITHIDKFTDKYQYILDGALNEVKANVKNIINPIYNNLYLSINNIFYSDNPYSEFKLYEY
jgi:adenylosuccinate synthase